MSKKSKTSLVIATAICAGCLIFGLGDSWAKEKVRKPIQERFEATISPVFVSTPNSRLAIAIEEFTSDQELQDLAQTFLSRGKRALEDAMGKFKKGHLDVPGGEGMPIEILESEGAGAVRNLTILAERGLNNRWGVSQQLAADYPYIFVQLEVNEQGNGKGTLIRFAKLAFNPQGRMVIENWGRQRFQLINVHLVK